MLALRAGAQALGTPKESEGPHAEEEEPDDADARIKAIEEAEARASQEAAAAEAALLARYGKQA